MSRKGQSILLLLAGLTMLSGCLSQIGVRRFATHPEPATTQNEGITLEDDGSILFTKDRLEISIRILDDEFLNRQFAAYSEQGVESTNPYTYGDWTPWGQEWTPQRFTVALVKIKNYSYPKIILDPSMMRITTDNNREYFSLDRGLLEDYFSSYLQSYSGQTYSIYREVTDRLNRSVLKADPIFSGQEESGYIVFPLLHNDVKNFRVHVPEVAVRFDYKNDPIETLDLEYQFQREVYKAIHPRAASN
jgi:hypothetical protein